MRSDDATATANPNVVEPDFNASVLGASELPLTGPSRAEEDTRCRGERFGVHGRETAGSCSASQAIS